MLEYCSVSLSYLYLWCVFSCGLLFFLKGYIFHQFNDYWIREKPESVMAFPSVKDQFAANLKTKLSNTPPTLMRIINRK